MVREMSFPRGVIIVLGKMKICDVLCNLVPFAQFKKCEKHSWRSVSFK